MNLVFALILLAHRIVPRESAGVLLQTDWMDESGLMLMQRSDPVEVRVQAEVWAIVP
jgi:hypothetical protein